MYMCMCARVYIAGIDAKRAQSGASEKVPYDDTWAYHPLNRFPIYGELQIFSSSCAWAILCCTRALSMHGSAAEVLSDSRTCISEAIALVRLLLSPVCWALFPANMHF
jgi:hypothetical protein|mmetsp:Transcript_52213/g.85835  ORF Transcript_52213/g.85835 Transcript_52213/m.85835 type:complete len:108 (+) Transcript_52213:1139-1462(+)